MIITSVIATGITQSDLNMVNLNCCNISIQWVKNEHKLSEQRAKK